MRRVTVGTQASPGLVRLDDGFLHLRLPAGVHRVEAQFELAGVQAERLTVARFTPPSPRLARPARVTVRRRGALLEARTRSGSTRTGHCASRSIRT